MSRRKSGTSERGAVLSRVVKKFPPWNFFTYSKLGVGSDAPTPRVISSPYAYASGLVRTIPVCTQACERLFHRPVTGWLRGVLLCGAVLCMLSGLASAAEIRVVDAYGLTRAIRKVERPVDVTISIKSGGPAAEAPRLGNTDGLAGDLQGNWQPPDKYIFKGVTEGTWQIKDSRLQVVEVVIGR